MLRASASASACVAGVCKIETGSDKLVCDAELPTVCVRVVADQDSSRADHEDGQARRSAYCGGRKRCACVIFSVVTSSCSFFYFLSADLFGVMLLLDTAFSKPHNFLRRGKKPSPEHTSL